MNKYILITSALPYPNGHLHLGHILEFTKSDILSRFNHQNNNKCFYFSGIDAHGTPIMLKALKENILPEKIITHFLIAYKKDLKLFNINYTNFYKTNSYENEIIVRKIFFKLYEKQLIKIKNIKQLYDLKLKIFLPDRYITGTCPKCKINDQYGDICNSCNFNYNAIDLINPISKLTNEKPIIKISTHYFYKLNKTKKYIKRWSKQNLTQKDIIKKLTEWLKIKLKDWNISRDIPYFGLKIPSEYKKFFYVWMDAPIGYFASMQNYFLKNNINFFYFFLKKNYFKFYHIIGKDIIYFHTLFWISILKILNFKQPKNIFVHGFITINNNKMSKSKNTFINCNYFKNKITTDYIRYYFATKLNKNITDINFNINELIYKINSDLIGKFTNILSRIIHIIIKHYNGYLSNIIKPNNMLIEFSKIKNIIKLLYKKRQFNKIIKIIMLYTEKINKYLEKEKPWHLCKTANTLIEAQIICTTALKLFIILLYYIKPIIPNITCKIEKILNITKDYNITNLNKIFSSMQIKNYKHITLKLKNIIN